MNPERVRTISMSIEEVLVIALAMHAPLLARKFTHHPPTTRAHRPMLHTLLRVRHRDLVDRCCDLTLPLLHTLHRKHQKLLLTRISLTLPLRWIRIPLLLLHLEALLLLLQLTRTPLLLLRLLLAVCERGPAVTVASVTLTVTIPIHEPTVTATLTVIVKFSWEWTAIVVQVAPVHLLWVVISHAPLLQPRLGAVLLLEMDWMGTRVRLTASSPQLVLRVLQLPSVPILPMPQRLRIPLGTKQAGSVMVAVWRV